MIVGVLPKTVVAAVITGVSIYAGLQVLTGFVPGLSDSVGSQGFNTFVNDIEAVCADSNGVNSAEGSVNIGEDFEIETSGSNIELTKNGQTESEASVSCEANNDKTLNNGGYYIQGENGGYSVSQ